MKIRTATTAQSPEELLNDLHALVRDAEIMLNGTVEAASAEAFTSLRARFDAAQEGFAALYTSAKKNITDWQQCTDHAIRANPYQAVGLALGTGLLLGDLLGRRCT